MADVRPFVSVIVVCRNSEKVLDRCLEHLLAQDYPAYDVVVVDDASEDQTLSVAEKAIGSGRVTVVHSPLNRGCPGARNLGLHYATGEIIAFIDADGFANRSWLSKLVAVFQEDDTIGAVASTVFLAWNPLVLNGAGGGINRQGWAGDLSIGEPYEDAELATEAVYPMGCGMAVRRAVVDEVGPFDDRMFSREYDDVDYGIRIWRAGYRIAVASDAWIDHMFSQVRTPSSQKRLLCERHRMRVVLKNWPLPDVSRWAFHEARAISRAWSPARELKLKAVAWNVRHLPSTLVSRGRMRRLPPIPSRLIDPSRHEGFHGDAPPLVKPQPETATHVVDMAERQSEGQLLYGWFPPENSAVLHARWAGGAAALLLRSERRARRLRIQYTHVPENTGGVDVYLRTLASSQSDPSDVVWATHLRWRYIERSLENHPVALPAGYYEVVFKARGVWSDPPRESRQLGFALSRLSLDQTFEVSPGDLDLSRSEIQEQLVNGWYEPEYDGSLGFRWADAQAAVMARLVEPATCLRLRYRLPPLSTGPVTMFCHEAEAPDHELCRLELATTDAGWRETAIPLSLAPGDYMLRFEASNVWSNPNQQDARFASENRALGFALASVAFENGGPGS